MFVASHYYGIANRWGNSGWLFWGGSKITAASDCSHEIKRCLLFGRRIMTNLDIILKSRDITLSTNVRLVKAIVFPVVMYGCESWTIKKAECWKIDAFELWCWKRLLKFPCAARRSNQSILKEISPGCSLEGLMLKLKLQYFGHLMQRVDSLEKTLLLRGIGDRRRRGRQRMRSLGGITTSMDMGLGRLWQLVSPAGLLFMSSHRVRYDCSTGLNWMAPEERKNKNRTSFAGYRTSLNQQLHYYTPARTNPPGN